MARSYRKTYIETRGTHKGSLALKVFSSWDYSVATIKAASLNKRRIYNEIKVWAKQCTLRYILPVLVRILSHKYTFFCAGSFEWRGISKPGYVVAITFYKHNYPIHTQLDIFLPNGRNCLIHVVLARKTLSLPLQFCIQQSHHDHGDCNFIGNECITDWFLLDCQVTCNLFTRK